MFTYRTSAFRFNHMLIDLVASSIFSRPQTSILLYNELHMSEALDLFQLQLVPLEYRPARRCFDISAHLAQCRLTCIRRGRNAAIDVLVVARALRVLLRKRIVRRHGGNRYSHKRLSDVPDEDVQQIMRSRRFDGIDGAQDVEDDDQQSQGKNRCQTDLCR